MKQFFFSWRYQVRNLLAEKKDSQILHQQKAPEITGIINQEDFITLIINLFILSFFTEILNIKKIFLIYRLLKGNLFGVLFS